jgi:hypothetical protein
VRCLLYGISKCLDPAGAGETTKAWSANLEYIVAHMSATTFSFVKLTSSRRCLTCGDCLFVGTSTEYCEDCTTSVVSMRPTTVSLNIDVVVGESNKCYSIREASKELSEVSSE